MLSLLYGGLSLSLLITHVNFIHVSRQKVHHSMQYIIGASSIWTSSKEVWAAIYDYPLFFLGGEG